MYTIKYNMLALKHMLEAKTNKIYSWAQIAEESNIHGNTIQKMARNETARVDLDVMARLLSFFHSVGVQITPGDLFIVGEFEPNIRVRRKKPTPKLPATGTVNDIGIVTQSDPGEPKNSL